MYSFLVFSSLAKFSATRLSLACSLTHNDNSGIVDSAQAHLCSCVEGQPCTLFDTLGQSSPPLCTKSHRIVEILSGLLPVKHAVSTSHPTRRHVP
jgi:hypothetical protein